MHIGLNSLNSWTGYTLKLNLQLHGVCACFLKRESVEMELWTLTNLINLQTRCVSRPRFSIFKSNTGNMSLILSLVNTIKLYQLGFLLRFCYLNESCENNNSIALGTTTDTHLFALLQKTRTNRLVVDSFLPRTWVLAALELLISVIG